jgi:hypothetical protein
MRRSAAALGLFVAMLAVFAVGASSAMATDDVFLCRELTGCKFLGFAETKFFLGKEEVSREFKCKKTEFAGKLVTGEAVLKAIPAYKECTAFGSDAAETFGSENCEWLFEKPEDLEEEPTDRLHKALGRLVSVPGKLCFIEIAVPATGCKVIIKEQGPLSSVEFIDEKELTKEVYAQMTMVLKLTHIAVTASSKCPEEGAREMVSGGSVLVEGIYLN